MSENLEQSLTYSLGLIHGTKNVLKRIFTTIDNNGSLISDRRLSDFLELLKSINETLVVQENGKFIIDRDGEIVFAWIQERRELVTAEIKAVI